MLTSNIKVPAGGTEIVKFPFNRASTRRLLININTSSVTLYYNGIQILTSNLYQSLYEIEFKSYYGFPDASKFKLSNSSNIDAYVKVLIDSAPNSSINDDYFDAVPSL